MAGSPPRLNILANLLFIRSDVNNVTWTLQIELIGSLLLPFLALFAVAVKLAISPILF